MNSPEQPPEDQFRAQVESFRKSVNRACREQRDPAVLKTLLRATVPALAILVDELHKRNVIIEQLKREKAFFEEGLSFLAPVYDQLPVELREQFTVYIQAADAAKTKNALREHMSGVNANRGMSQEDRAKVFILDAQLRSDNPRKTKRWYEIGVRMGFTFGQVRHVLEPRPRQKKTRQPKSHQKRR